MKCFKLKILDFTSQGLVGNHLFHLSLNQRNNTNKMPSLYPLHLSVLHVIKEDKEDIFNIVANRISPEHANSGYTCLLKINFVNNIFWHLDSSSWLIGCVLWLVGSRRCVQRKVWIPEVQMPESETVFLQVSGFCCGFSLFLFCGMCRPTAVRKAANSCCVKGLWELSELWDYLSLSEGLSHWSSGVFENMSPCRMCHMFWNIVIGFGITILSF